MKKIVLIVGPNGVGKSTTAKKILPMLSKAAYIDSDWCRVINPFSFSEAIKTTITQNLYCMLRSYLLCEEVETVIFTYGLHGERQEIWNRVLKNLKEDKIDFELCPIILKCSEEENIRRARQDNRDNERIERGMKNTFSFYDKYSYPSLDTTGLTPEEAATKVIKVYCL